MIPIPQLPGGTLGDMTPRPKWQAQKRVEELQSLWQRHGQDISLVGQMDV
jgi:hypothetical protein